MNASQFAGGGFMAEAGAGNMSTGKKAENSGNKAQTVRALTIKQLHTALQEGTVEEARLDGKPIENVSIIGKVIAVSNDNLTFTVYLDDGTGKIVAKQFNSPNGDDEVERQKRSEIREGVYVRVHGHFTSTGGESHIQVFNIRPVGDHNEVTFHMLQCVFQHAHFTKGSAGAAPATLQNEFAAAGGYAAPAPGATYAANGMSPVQTEVYAVFQSPQAKENEQGISIRDVTQSLGGRIPEHQVKEAIDYLVNEGHLYSTIDEYHYKSCM